MQRPGDRPGKRHDRLLTPLARRATEDDEVVGLRDVQCPCTPEVADGLTIERREDRAARGSREPLLAHRGTLHSAPVVVLRDPPALQRSIGERFGLRAKLVARRRDGAVWNAQNERVQPRRGLPPSALKRHVKSRVGPVESNG